MELHTKYKPITEKHETHSNTKINQWLFQFENGYGASVVCHHMIGVGIITYGDAEHPYELGVLKNGYLCYTTPIADDVIGCLTEKEIEEILERIEKL